MKKCKVENCGKKYYAKGYCIRHYNQYQEYGEIFKRTKYDPNEIINYDNYYEIVLYSGQSKQKEKARTKIDKDDLDKIKKYKWCFGGKYVYSGAKPKIRLHRLILGKKEGYIIDHINGNTLDNRKCNLRFATKSQNCMNSKSNGISFNKIKRKWIAQIQVNYKIIYLGCFNNKNEALKIRQIAEKKYFGEFAYKRKVCF